MKSNFVYIAFFMTFHVTALMGQAGFEQYYYVARNTTPLMVPIIHIQGDNNWYTEVRYNYEEKNSFALYAGKCFSSASSKLFEYSLTPIAGGVFGDFNGGSIGLNSTADYKKFFYASQMQFTFSSNGQYPDFFFGWYEVGYSPADWVWFGCSMQHTRYARAENNVTEAGIMLGFNVGKWSFPLYSFNPLGTNPNFVLGITHVLGLTNKQR